MVALGGTTSVLLKQGEDGILLDATLVCLMKDDCLVDFFDSPTSEDGSVVTLSLIATLTLDLDDGELGTGGRMFDCLETKLFI